MDGRSTFKCFFFFNKYYSCRNRKFSKLFGSLDTYYKNKERRAEIDNELAILADLYNTQEMEAEMERLKARQEARRAALDTKGRAKADKMTEKAAKKQRKE